MGSITLAVVLYTLSYTTQSVLSMKYYLVMLMLLISVSLVNSTYSRERRDTCDRNKVKAAQDACTFQAYEDYKKAFQAGNDGRPDWMARKSCNYMVASVEDCGNLMIGDCYTKEDVTKMKDDQIVKVLEQLQSSVKEWDSEKCPATKAHIDRMKMLEEAVQVKTSKQERQPANHSPPVTVSVSLVMMVTVAVTSW